MSVEPNIPLYPSSLCRTKIQIAERIFYFVLPTIDPPVDIKSIENREASMSELEGDDDDDDSSSLSEVTDSDLELSPLMQSVTDVNKGPSLLGVASFRLDNNHSQGGSIASTSAAGYPLAKPGRGLGKSGHMIEAVRAGKGLGKGKGKGKAAKPGRPKTIKAPTQAGNPAAGRGGKGKGKGKGVPKKISSTKLPRPLARLAHDSDLSELSDLDDYDMALDPPAPSLPPPPSRRGIEPRKAATAAAAAIVSTTRAEAIKVPASFLVSPVLHPTPGPPLAGAPLPTLESAIPGAAVVPVDLAPAAIKAEADEEIDQLADDPLPGGHQVGSKSTRGGKAGRGRPPKDGVAAQRPRKPKVAAKTLIGPVNNPALFPAPAPVRAKSPKPKQPFAHHAGIHVAPSAPPGSAPEPLPLAPGYAAVLPTPTSVLVASTSTTLPADADAGPGLPKVEGEPGASTGFAPPGDPLVKPPYTYASLIAQAVSSVETRKLTLNGIYDWITARWPYFSENQNGWQVCQTLFLVVILLRLWSLGWN